MLDAPIFFDGSGGVVRTIFSAALMYVAIVIAMRLFGKRSTSQMNNFDWIVTVALGSLMASGILVADVTVLEGVAAMYTLLGLQWLLTHLLRASDTATRTIKSKPTLLVLNGKILRPALVRERIIEEEIYAAVRQAGYSRISDIAWIVLETNSKLSVISCDQAASDPDMLRNVAGAGQPEDRRSPDQVTVHG